MASRSPSPASARLAVVTLSSSSAAQRGRGEGEGALGLGQYLEAARQMGEPDERSGHGGGDPAPRERVLDPRGILALDPRSQEVEPLGPQVTAFDDAGEHSDVANGEHGVADPERLEAFGRDRHHFGVAQVAGAAQPLEPHLVELALAAGLGRLVAQHLARVVEPYGRRRLRRAGRRRSSRAGS